MTTTSPEGRSGAVLRRLTPLAGVLFAVLTVAAYLTMDEFPDGSTPAGDLPAFYAAHGGRVSLGGTILGLAGICFGVFGAAMWARLRDRRVPAVVAGVALLGAAVDTMADLNSAAVYNLLGSIGVDPHVTASALQAWHISGAEFGVGGGATLFLLATAVAGIAYRAVPRWVGWTGLALAVAPFLPSPFGFFGSLIFLLVGRRGRPGARRPPGRADPADRAGPGAGRLTLLGRAGRRPGCPRTTARGPPRLAQATGCGAAW